MIINNGLLRCSQTAMPCHATGNGDNRYQLPASESVHIYVCVTITAHPLPHKITNILLLKDWIRGHSYTDSVQAFLQSYYASFQSTQLTKKLRFNLWFHWTHALVHVCVCPRIRMHCECVCVCVCVCARVYGSMCVCMHVHIGSCVLVGIQVYHAMVAMVAGIYVSSNDCS